MRAPFNAVIVLLVGCGGATGPGLVDPAEGDAGEPAPDVSRDSSTADAAACTISASNYDPSCAVDNDCTMVSSGDYCAQICLCGGSAISVGALAQFNADVSKTPIGSGTLTPLGCFCPLEGPPCCRAGVCTTNCSSPTYTLAACSEAGGICTPLVACGQLGPSSACASADECCLPLTGVK